MKESSEQPSNQYDIVIIECCENCETHQNFSRHSEWKYFEQFNEIKRKIEKFIPNTIVIKNPVPDELTKTPEIQNQKNLFINKDSNQKIIYPRIGSFEIYIYNILISSKLLTTQWPNHYKILQILNRIMEEKKKGNPLDQFSVFNQTETIAKIEPTSKEISSLNESPEKKNVRISSKKKKGPHGLPGKAYKSIDKGYDPLKELKSTLDPVTTKIQYKDDISPYKGKKNVHRYLESKGEQRVKLPSLSNTMGNLSNQLQEEKKISQKKIVNTIEQIDQEDLSRIENKNSEIYQSRKFSLLELKSQENQNNSVVSVKQQLKFFEDHSVQYSEPEGKDLMNRSIQYEEEEGFYCDFGMQIDEDSLTKDKEINFQWVQTDRVELRNQPKPYTLEDEVQVNIVVQIPSNIAQTQTTIKHYVDSNLGTEMVATVSRQIQFPEQTSKKVNIDEVVDTNFQHMYEKRRNITDNEDYFSIDRFEEKTTKYKWIGKGNIIENPQDLKKKMFIQSLVFSVYNYYGIKTPEKRLSYQICSNVVGEKLKEGLLHILTFDNPELQYVTQFEDFNYTNRKFPISELITFKSSKQIIKFNNYGGFLALAYFLNDFQIFNPQNNQLGFVIVNQAVKEIHKLSALNYKIHPQTKNSDQQIIISLDNNAIKINRLSQSVELQFFSMLLRICDSTTFEELINYIREIFVHSASTYQQFKMTLLSLHLNSSEEQTVEDFIRMLENRVQKIKEIFKGKLYTFKKYHSLNPNIKYALPFDHKIERRLHFKDKIVSSHDIVKHLRNNNTLVIIQGEEGSGKTTLLSEMTKQLKSIETINAISISWLRKEPLKIKEEMFQLSKNIILLDNTQKFEVELMNLIQFMSKSTYEYSICISTTNLHQKDIIKHRFDKLNIVNTSLLPFTNDEIKEYMMKVIKSKSYTDKKDIVEGLVENPKYIKILENPFFLSLYTSYLSTVDTSSYKPSDSEITKYSILKQAFSACTSAHGNQMKEMDFLKKEALPNLRRIAFQYYHNGQQINQVIKDIIVTYEQNQLIRSQLVYYPLNLDSIILVKYQSLFSHQLFLKFFLIQAYSYFVEKGFRNMRMEKIYNDKFLLELIIQRYSIQNSYSQLLEVVMSTKKFKTISEASSNALTLLGKMNYVFSNLNFDDCIVPFADLSNTVFYQCSFRGADLQEAILYKSQMISCTFDGAAMARINLFSRKYQIEFTAMTCSISVDNRRLAFGCGNYLIILNAETGTQIKRIEAHLDIIRVVKYTRDGNSLVTIADDKTLRIWDIYTYKSVVFKLPQKGSISYSNETQTIASVSKNILKVWNLKSMANEAQLEGHTESITCIEFSHDGEYILTGSKDTTLRLWTLKGRQINVFKGHDEQVVVGKLSPSKRTMVSSSKGKDLIMWSIQSGTKLLSKKFMSEVTQICLDNKDKFILVTFSNDNHIVILDFLNFNIIHALTGHQAKIMSLHFDHNFKQLVSLGKDRTARVWQFDRIMQNEIRHPKITTKIKKGPVLALAYDKSKLIYVTSHENGQLNIWNAEDNSLKDQLISHSGPVRCLAIDKASKIYSGGSDGSLRIWNLETKREPRVIEIHSSQMIQMKLSQKSRLIATSSVANQLVIHDFTGIKIIMSTREEGRVHAIAFSPDEKLMAVGGAEKYVAIYEVINSNTVNRTQELGQHSDAVSVMTFFGDFLLVVALKNGQVAIWNHHRASLIKKIENVSPIKTLMHFQKKFICFSSQDGKIRIVNMDEGKEVRVFRYSETPTAFDINEDQSLLVVGTNQGNVMKWNLNCVKPPSKKIEFDRKAIDQECSRIVTIQSGRQLLIKDLFYHREELVNAQTDSDIEGVTFDGDKIILLLKNGKYWQYGKRQYKFHMTHYQEGDLHSIRDKTTTNFFKSGIKKIKGMTKPSLAILEQINQM